MTIKKERLETILESMGPIAVAVSGGVDSMTLAIAATVIQPESEIFHAISAAVPPRATARVRRYAEDKSWLLREIHAGEFLDQRYVENPYNRCYHCKQNLYGKIRECTSLSIVSGANLDDLSDYRPGLVAAERYGVRHPYIEASMSKDDVRSLARVLDTDYLSDLPASPCLSSRVETGIGIDAETLASIDSIELWIANKYTPKIIRCRVLRGGVKIELDNDCISRLTQPEFRDIKSKIKAVFASNLSVAPVEFGVYEMGSAFVQDVTSVQ